MLEPRAHRNMKTTNASFKGAACTTDAEDVTGLNIIREDNNLLIDICCEDKLESSGTCSNIGVRRIQSVCCLLIFHVKGPP
mmetsp:Transcript_23603/g.33870  ORF Transcript_23603/g.33870 Transcript_23603/m.33870 type:complete len:81 (-) Transcript_23603:266-508(-)